jgi:hypothetical protein
MLDRTARCDDNKNESEWGRRATSRYSPSLGFKDLSSAMGGIPPSIAALVMRCKVLLSLSIQCIGGGLRWPLYCCTSTPPLSLLPSNIEARALRFRRAPAAMFSCRRPTCFPRAPAAIISCRCPTTLLTPRTHCDLFQPNASATATPLPSFDAAMPLLFKSCRCSCNLLLLQHYGRLV